MDPTSSMIVRHRSDRSLVLHIDQRLYAKDAIAAAVYVFSDRFHILMETSNDDANFIDIILEPKDGSSCEMERIVKELANELLEQQIRHYVENRFGNIRDEIVKAAFRPITS